MNLTRTETEPNGDRRNIALVGHCGPDSITLRRAVIVAAGSGAQVISVDDDGELAQLLKEGVDLLLVNRLLAWGFAQKDGVKLIRHLREQNPQLRMMLVSNYPDAQAAAESAGAMPGFGKNDMTLPETVRRIRSAMQ